MAPGKGTLKSIQALVFLGLNLALLIFGSIIAGMCNQASVDSLQPLDLSAIEQLQKDWTQRPIVGVKVKNVPCEGADVVPIFTRKWKGTVKGCALESGDVQTITDFRNDMINEGVYEKKCERPMKAADSFVQDSFYESYICGKLGGAPFVEALRPNVQGFCPTGTVACTNQTSIENTICQKPDDKRYCPVTDIKFTYIDDKASFSALANKEFDALPISSTKVEHRPCMLPNETSSAPNAKYYPVEIDSNNTCSTDPISKQEHDDRYSKCDYAISEYEMQKDSGVYLALTEAPSATKYLSDSPLKNKIETLYTLWQRPTLSWNIECDADEQRNRVAALKEIKSTQELAAKKPHEHLGGVRTTAICIVIFSALSLAIGLPLSYYMMKDDSNQLIKAFLGLSIISFIGCFVPALFSSIQSSYALSVATGWSERTTRLRALVEGCGSDHLQIIDEVEVEGAKPQNYIAGVNGLAAASLALSIGLAASIGVGGYILKKFQWD